MYKDLVHVVAFSAAVSKPAAWRKQQLNCLAFNRNVTANTPDKMPRLSLDSKTCSFLKNSRQDASAFHWNDSTIFFALVSYLSDNRVTGGELFEDIVAREYYSEADAR